MGPKILLVLLYLHLHLVESVDNGDRIACYPLNESQLNSTYCQSKGCVWDDTNVKVKCYLPLDGAISYGYELTSTPVSTQRGLRVDLRRRRLGGSVLPPSLYGGDVDEVTFEATYYSDQSLGFALYPKGVNPSSLRPPVSLNLVLEPLSSPLYTVRIVDSNIGQPFNFQVIRRGTGAVLFDSSLGGLTIADQFLMISTKLPTQYLYGFGENDHDTFQHDMDYRMWSMWSRDRPPGVRDLNLYGVHPFYMASEADGSSHGVFLFNSHSTDVTTMRHPGITFRTVGGMLEFFVFLGPDPETVVQQYTGVIGRTFMPPYFSLGFQLSRWGYRNTSQIREAVDRTIAAQIPLDIQYADIDYMEGKKDFTIDPINFGDLPQLVDQLKTEGIRFIVILDPAIANDYDVYFRGKAANVFIQWANSTLRPPEEPFDNDIIFGTVWPQNRTAFPDFFKASTKQWWTNEVQAFYQKLKFDALWIDMNEVSSFYTNIRPGYLHCPVNKWDDPPYITKASLNGGLSGKLSDQTICMATKLGENGEYLNYQVHSLYGYTQSIATQSTVRQVTGKRSMVLSRSTFSGSGQYAGHWLGDNQARWAAVGDSIIGMLEFNLFGIPYVGADICGFAGNSDEELCERWMELGAFYPFSRNHNGRTAEEQDPGVWPDTVAVSSRNALNIRYRLLPYLYTLFYDSHTTGSTVARPLYHEYPKDNLARSIDQQFLWGPALLISPVVEQGQTRVFVYIPDDVWYDYYTGAQLTVTGLTDLAAPRNFINLHLRGGYILPAQKPAMNTALSRQNNFELLVSLKNGRASGKLFWDDGESIDTIGTGQYQINNFDFANNALTITVTKGSVTWPGIVPVMDQVYVMGLPSRPASITIDGVSLAPGDYVYDANRRLKINCSLNMNNNHVINFL